MGPSPPRTQHNGSAGKRCVPFPPACGGATGEPLRFTSAPTRDPDTAERKPFSSGTPMAAHSCQFARVFCLTAKGGTGPPPRALLDLGMMSPKRCPANRRDVRREVVFRLGPPVFEAALLVAFPSLSRAIRAHCLVSLDVPTQTGIRFAGLSIRSRSFFCLWLLQSLISGGGCGCSAGLPESRRTPGRTASTLPPRSGWRWNAPAAPGRRSALCRATLRSCCP